MKKLILTFLFLSPALKSYCQNIENPSFDSVYLGGIDRIFQWITSDAWPVFTGDTVIPYGPNDHYTSPGLQFHEALTTVQIEYSNAYDGPYAIKIITDTGRVDIFGNPYRSFIFNGDDFFTDSNGYLDLSKGGIPFSYRPYKMMGHYKLVDNSPSLHNFPEAYILLKKYNTLTQTSDTIGYASAAIQLFPTSTWSPFEMPINYISNQMPDSIIVAFLSPPLGVSTLWVDSLGFDYTFPSQVVDLKNNSISFYLNQQENKIRFQSIENFSEIKIYNTAGQIVLSFTKPSSEIDVSPLKIGTYLLSVDFKNKSTGTTKFIIKE